MPLASSIVIRVGGTDITNKVLFASARFVSVLGAVPGTADFIVKDEDQTFDATTGDTVELELDGVIYWGGFSLAIDRIFALPVVDTTDPGSVKARQFRVQATDWNILFDRRVIHNPADHLSHLPYFALDRTMGELLREELFALYLDLDDDGLDTTTFVDDTFVPRFDASGNPDPDGSKQGSWPQQGLYWRKAMDDFAQFGTIYYIDGNRNVHFHEVEDVVTGWGFSDVPNRLGVGVPGATYGMREFEHAETAGGMSNDALVWGGSEWAGSGGTVFARKQNASSITQHGRWQIPEVRFGDLRTQGEVTARANVMVSGNTTGAVGGDTSRGLGVDEVRAKCIWFAHDVPFDGPSRAHILPGFVVPFSIYVFSEDGLTPLEFVLPLRQVTVTFPTIPSDGTPDEPLTYARFDGQFGLQLSDPYYLWKLIRDVSSTSKRPTISTANGSTTAAVYGAIGSFAPTPSTDGSTTVFTIPFAYIEGTVDVYKGPAGQLAYQVRGVDFTESSASTGEITFLSAPSGSHVLWVVCRIAGGIS